MEITLVGLINEPGGQTYYWNSEIKWWTPDITLATIFTDKMTAHREINRPIVFGRQDIYPFFITFKQVSGL